MIHAAGTDRRDRDYPLAIRTVTPTVDRAARPSTGRNEGAVMAGTAHPDIGSSVVAMEERPPGRRRWLYAVLVFLVVGVVVVAVVVVTNRAAPSPAPKPAARKSAAPQASPTPSAEATAASAALAAYAGYQAAYDRAALTADERLPGMDRYARGNALSLAFLDMRRYRIADTVYRGREKTSPRVTQVLLNARPPRVVISDCVDGSGVQLVNRRTGKVVPRVDPQGRPATSFRHPAVAWAEYVAGAGWFITQSSARADQAC